MSSRSPARGVNRLPPPAAEQLLGFRIPLLASIRSSTSARRNERKFGLKNLEGRTLFVLGAHEGLSLKEVMRIGGIEKAYASRTIAALVEKGLVTKAVDGSDRRSVRLTLTEPGNTLYEAVLQDAQARDEEWFSVLSPRERTALLD
jgi:DNA-binding MarR family transcriptional regulator